MNISQEEFDRILEEMLEEMPASNLLTVPGIYEIVAEHFNNDVLREWSREHEDDPGPRPAVIACSECGGDMVTLGRLGNLEHFRCRDCGIDSSFPAIPEWLTVGRAVQLARVVDRYPHFCCPKGLTGTVTAVDDDYIAVMMEQHIPGAEEWDNEIRWEDKAWAEAFDDLEPLRWPDETCHFKGA